MFSPLSQASSFLSTDSWLKWCLHTELLLSIESAVALCLHHTIHILVLSWHIYCYLWLSFIVTTSKPYSFFACVPSPVSTTKMWGKDLSTLVHGSVPRVHLCALLVVGTHEWMSESSMSQIASAYITVICIPTCPHVTGWASNLFPSYPSHPENPKLVR